MTPEEAWLRAQGIRCKRTLEASWPHLPKWIAAVIPIALVIPGPQDEVVVALLIAWAAWRRPLLRAAIREGWGSIYA